METVSYLAPLAFVFAIAALSQISALKKEIKNLKTELDKLKNS